MLIKTDKSSLLLTFLFFYTHRHCWDVMMLFYVSFPFCSDLLDFNKGDFHVKKADNRLTVVSHFVDTHVVPPPENNSIQWTAAATQAGWRTYPDHGEINVQYNAQTLLFKPVISSVSGFIQNTAD